LSRQLEEGLLFLLGGSLAAVTVIWGGNIHSYRICRDPGLPLPQRCAG
jgi:hypothetical protein